MMSQIAMYAILLIFFVAIHLNITNSTGFFTQVIHSQQHFLLFRLQIPL